MSEEPKRGWGSALALVVAAALTGSAACSDDTSDLPPPASPPPPPTAATAGQTPGLDLSPAEQQAVDEAKAKFDEFMNAYIDVSTADVPTAEVAEQLFYQLDKHLAGVLSQELRGEIVGRWGKQQVASGSLDWRLAKVIDVDLDRRVEGENIPRVSLQYCVDTTDWVAIEADTGNSVGESGGRQLWRYGVSWSDDWFGQSIEGWKIAERQGQGDESC